MTQETLLEIDAVSVDYETDTQPVRAVDNVSLTVDAGDVVGVVGESGSGKSTLARAIVGTLHLAHARVTNGHISFRGQDLVAMREPERRAVRGREIGFVPQESLHALNPVQRVGDQVAEMLIVHRGLSRRAARAGAIELLEHVEMPDAAHRARAYPHQLSGGMRQRVTIAIAIALRPALVIADEPTSALDPTIQAQILDLLDRLRREHGMALLLITHDLTVVADIAARVVVMQHGHVVESGEVGAIFAAPAHDHTSRLLAAIPRLGARDAR